MSKSSQPDRKFELESKIVDQVLGEPNTLLEVEQLVHTDPGLARFREGISKLDQLLKESAEEMEGSPPSPWQMSADRREELLEQLKKAHPRGTDASPTHRANPIEQRQKKRRAAGPTIAVAAVVTALAIASSLLFDPSDRGADEGILSRERESPLASSIPEPTRAELPPVIKNEFVDEPSAGDEDSHQVATEPLSKRGLPDLDKQNMTSWENGQSGAADFPELFGNGLPDATMDAAVARKIDPEAVLESSIRNSEVDRKPSAGNDVQKQFNSLDARIRIEAARLRRCRALWKTLPEIDLLQEFETQIKAQIARSETAVRKREEMLKTAQALQPDQLDSLVGELDKLILPVLPVPSSAAPSEVVPTKELDLMSDPPGHRNPVEYRHSLLAKLTIERQRLESELRQVYGDRQIPDLEKQRSDNAMLMNHFYANLAKCRELERKIRRMKQGAPVAVEELEASVVAVNSDWNFLMINQGSDHGLTAETSILLQRSGRVVGRGKIERLESQFAVVLGIENAAVGDTVLFENPAEPESGATVTASREQEQKPLVGEILSVNHQWGFAVINQGRSSGVEAGQKLDVVRSGRKVGSLEIVRVETGSSIAKIQGSVAAGDKFRHAPQEPEE